jgi:hypothetical protein
VLICCPSSPPKVAPTFLSGCLACILFASRHSCEVSFRLGFIHTNDWFCRQKPVTGMFCCLRANNSLFGSRWRRPQIKITNHKSVATVGPWKWGSVRSLAMMITMFNKVNRLTYGTMHRNMHQHLATSTVLLPLLPIKAVRTSTLPPPSIAPLRKRIAPLAPIWWLRGKSDVWWGTTSLYSLPDWVEGHSQ